jgi:hypothetical protein
LYDFIFARAPYKAAMHEIESASKQSTMQSNKQSNQ